MVKALYSAASGMFGQQLRQEAVANNIANVSTTGYKKAIAAHRGFYQIFLDAIAIDNLRPGDVPGGGMLLDGTASDLSQGAIEHTGEPFDVALDGPGFFVVQGPAGNNLYTRNGHFTLNEAGELVTENGYKVQGEGGAISASGAQPMVSDAGRVVADGTERGVLQVVTFEDPRVLIRVGDSMFAAPPNVFPSVAEPVRMVSGALEASNVSLAQEMLDMLVTARNFEANQRVILAVDSTLDKTINDVGRA